MSEQKPGDPADKGSDQFVQTVSHRAGYGDDKLDRLARLIDYLHRNPRATLASGEGALLLGEIDRLCAAIERVRALHKPISTRFQWLGVLCCSECSDDDSEYRYPCPTLRALDGDA